MTDVSRLAKRPHGGNRQTIVAKIVLCLFRVIPLGCLRLIVFVRGQARAAAMPQYAARSGKARVTAAVRLET